MRVWLARGQVPCEPPFQLRGRAGTAQQEPLRQLAAHLLECCELALQLDPLSNDRQRERLADTEDGSQEFTTLAAVGERSDERAVHLQDVDGHALEL